MVSDHLRHSLQTEYVEAPIMVIADVIDHTIDPKISLSLHQQVEELEAILVEIQEDLSVQVVHEVVQEVHEAMDEKERQDQKCKYWR